jgi:hypothetical protein
MGSLVNERTGQRVVLRANHVFGRHGARCDTYLQDQEVSRIHALVRWSGGRWYVVDQSRNGSFLDGQRLLVGQGVMLAAGQKLRFGSEESTLWRVAEVAPPASSLVPADDFLPPIVLARHNLLPTPAEPELCLYEVEDGQWVLDDDQTSRPLHDGDTVQLGGRSYRLQLPGESDETRTSLELKGASAPVLEFRLSLDEEHTQLQVRWAAQAADLGERSHHYCLVTLARQRLADARAGFDASAQGWLESQQLARMLGIEVTHLNIQIHRARDQLMGALPAVGALGRIVERQRGRLRLGDGLAFEIYRGSELEGRYAPQRA